MNQRIISTSPSILFSKGVTLKVGDWRSGEEAIGTVQPAASNPTLQRRPSNNWNMTNSSSSSSFRRLSASSSSSASSSFKQLDLQRLSSSGLASSKPISAMGNAVWGDTNPAKQNNHLNLCALKLDDPEIRLGRSSVSNMFLDRTCDRAQRGRSRSSLSNLLSLREEETSKHHKNATWDDDHFTTANTLVNNNVDSSRYVSLGGIEFVVDAFAAKVPKRIDIRDMSLSDLDHMKTDDAFMYYSIPGVKEALWQGKAVDLKDAKIQRTIVTRCSAISFESADMMIDDDELDILSLYDEFDNTKEDIDDIHGDDLFLAFLEKSAQ